MKAVNKFAGDLFRSLQKANQVPGKVPRSCSCEPERARERLAWNKQHHLSSSAAEERSCRSTSIAQTNIGPAMVSIKNQRESETVFLLSSQGNKNQENSHLANIKRATILQQPNFFQMLRHQLFYKGLPDRTQSQTL